MAPLSLTLVLATFATLITTTLAHNIQLAAHARECFHEVLHKDDKMTVTFQVGDREFGGAGNLEVDFWVSRFCFVVLWGGSAGEGELGMVVTGGNNIGDRMRNGQGLGFVG